jgi:hypothetical protein
MDAHTALPHPPILRPVDGVRAPFRSPFSDLTLNRPYVQTPSIP